MLLQAGCALIGLVVADRGIRAHGERPLVEHHPEPETTVEARIHLDVNAGALLTPK